MTAVNQGDDKPIKTLRNLGPTSAQWLRDVGIETIGDLRSQGPVLVFQRVKQQQAKVSWNLLWALAAGLEERDWRELSAAEKDCLRREIEG